MNEKKASHTTTYDISCFTKDYVSSEYKLAECYLTLKKYIHNKIYMHGIAKAKMIFYFSP